jgi:hypothetical protein
MEVWYHHRDVLVCVCGAREQPYKVYKVQKVKCST